ncbi:MAG: hypothetical protein HYY49_00495 [Ignavibacteriales bacterium]|nr:hypothetical protein [Ignavibacteriales bacterium]
MKSIIALTVVFILVGCKPVEVDRTPPAAPRGVRTISLDNAVEIQWLANTEPDVQGYNIWRALQYEGPYSLRGGTSNLVFVDNNANNGTTYYYALSAYDYEGNESAITKDVIYDTPRPEGYNVVLDDYRTSPLFAGYEFSSNTVGPYDDQFTDIFFENFNGLHFLNVWDDTEVQDMGYTNDLDEISVAPDTGWAPSKSAEAIWGHTYVVRTWDNHYAKVRVINVSNSQVRFDWAYQTAWGNPELKRDRSQTSERRRLTRPERVLP